MSYDFDEKPYEVEKKKLPYQTSLDLWQTALGLQETDGLKPSAYMVELATAHAKGEYTYQEVEENIKGYYASSKEADKSGRSEEADLAAVHISEILSEDGFVVSPITLKNYHKRIFQGIDSFRYPVGQYRKVNLSKSEDVLNGESVQYAAFSDIEETLNFDFGTERQKDYSGQTKREIAQGAITFVSGVWQIHPFREGNTRTVAVFLIKYLRNMGFKLDNDPFKHQAKFFRDALVLANAATTSELRTSKYLEMFIGNVLFGEDNELVIK